MKLWGPVITNINHITQIIEYKRIAKTLGMPYTAIKYITSWGMPWNDLTRAQALAATENPTVRTTAGDPSNRSATRYLLPDVVIKELTPWVAIKPDLMIELGNEPNIKDIDPWIYRWWLNESIKACRTEFPYAHIIAPALIHNDKTAQWLSILADIMTTCDSIGMHIYEHYGFFGAYPAKTDQYKILDKLYTTTFPNKDFYITELGINDPATKKAAKHRRYYEFTQSLPDRYIGALYYHINLANDIDPNYNLPIADLRT